jgi:hypothetical protein
MNQFMAEGQLLAGIRQDACCRPASRSALSAAERAFPASGASPLLPDASRKVLIDERRPARLGMAMPSSSTLWKHSTSGNGLP